MVLVIEGCDFVGFPMGGTLASTRQLLRVFAEGIALVGVSTDTTPVGRWVLKEFEGRRFPFFATGHRVASPRRPLVPGRLRFYCELQRHRREIAALGCRNAYLQAAESLLAVRSWRLERICFRFHGTANSLSLTRYPWARPLASFYERHLFRALDGAEVIMATDSEQAIQALCSRSRGRLCPERIRRLPTAVDTAVFRPLDRAFARATLGLPATAEVIAVCGRINRLKGWRFLLEAFQRLLRNHPSALLVFIGDGEDRVVLEKCARELNMAANLRVTGCQTPERVALYLNAADLVAVGSYFEGLSVAMLEALACGKPIVSTGVSGASELILEGQNGFVVQQRDPDYFASAMAAGMDLPGAPGVSRRLAEAYSADTLPARLAALWEPFGVCRPRHELLPQPVFPGSATPQLEDKP